MRSASPTRPSPTTAPSSGRNSAPAAPWSSSASRSTPRSNPLCRQVIIGCADHAELADTVEIGRAIVELAPTVNWLPWPKRLSVSTACRLPPTERDGNLRARPAPLAGWSDASSLRPTESSLKRRNRESKVIPRRLVAPGGCVASFACCGKATSANEKTSRPKAARASPKFGRPLASPWQPNYRLLGKLRFGGRNYVTITVGRGSFAGTAAASGDGKTEKRGSALDKPRFIVITISRGLGLQ